MSLKLLLILSMFSKTFRRLASALGSWPGAKEELMTQTQENMS